MRPYKIGGFADFLHHRGRSVWLGPGEGHACGSVGKFVCHRRLLSVHQIFQTCQLVLCGGLAEILTRKTDRGAHLQQTVIDTGMGGVLGVLQVLKGQVGGDNQRPAAAVAVEAIYSDSLSMYSCQTVGKSACNSATSASVRKTFS